MSIELAVKKAFHLKKERNWEHLFIAVDFHDTLFRGYYKPNQLIEPYPDAIPVLQWATRRKDIILIAYTCSYSEDFEKVNSELGKRFDIRFDFLNGNPLCCDTELAYFGDKFYFNLLLDDKAGFDPLTDWRIIQKVLVEIGEMP